MNVLNALTENQIQGVALSCFENERPLRGLIGTLDWKFNGAFTKLLRSNVITGQKGEVSYVPLKWNENTYHFLIVGGGENQIPGNRTKFTEAQIKMINQKTTDLAVTTWTMEGPSENDGQ